MNRPIPRMKRLSIDPDQPDPMTIASAVEALRAGGIVAYPTDTFYALAVDPRNDDAVRKLFAVKGRDAAAAIALIAGDAAQASHAGRLGPAEARLARSFWPGPLTVIVPAAPAMSRLLAAADGTLGVRVPAHTVARQLAIALGTCVTATSANLSGQPPAAAPDDVAAALADALDVLLDGGITPGGEPSTIVRVADGRPQLVRAGAVAWSRVLESLE